MSLDLPFVDYQWPGKITKNLVVIVGEAPGKEEVRQGRPFVGRSGQLLDKNLQAAGLLREECMIANVFRYQPPGNKVGHFFMSKRAADSAGEKLATEWGKLSGRQCRAIFGKELEHLAQTLNSVKPRVIVTLGSTPLWALTGLSGIVALRGQFQKCRFLDNIPVMPTFHPSYIIRGNWGLEPLLAEDLAKARLEIA